MTSLILDGLLVGRLLRLPNMKKTVMPKLTDSGLAAEITGKGKKYYKNTDLNQ